jgi:hypothetical protein
MSKLNIPNPQVSRKGPTVAVAVLLIALSGPAPVDAASVSYSLFSSLTSHSLGSIWKAQEPTRCEVVAAHNQGAAPGKNNRREPEKVVDVYQ